MNEALKKLINDLHPYNRNNICNASKFICKENGIIFDEKDTNITYNSYDIDDINTIYNIELNPFMPKTKDVEIYNQNNDLKKFKLYIEELEDDEDFDIFQDKLNIYSLLATKNNNFDILKYIDENYSFNDKYEIDMCLYSVKNNNKNMFKYLLERKHVSLPEKIILQICLYCTKYDYIDIISCLNLKLIRSKLDDSIKLSIYLGHIKIIKLLLNVICNSSRSTEDCVYEYLIYAIGNLKTTKFLINTYNIEFGDYLNPALIINAKYGHFDVVKYLVEHGADDLDYSALINSLNNKHYKISEYLLKKSIKWINNWILTSTLYKNYIDLPIDIEKEFPIMKNSIVVYRGLVE